MKKTMVLLVALLLIGSIPCNAIFKRKVVTSKIYSGKIEKVILSPNKKIERLLIIDDQDEIILYDVEKERLTNRYKMITNKYVIYAHSVSWEKSNKISLTKHILDLNGKAITSIRYETEDLVEFTELYQRSEVWERRLSNRGKVSIV